MKKIIQALLQSLPEFGNVGMFLIFVLILFATMGLHQYNGVFYNICRLDLTPASNSSSWPYDPNQDRICSQSALGNYQCPSNYKKCGNNDDYPTQLDISTDQIYNREYITYGIINFDNIAQSLLSVFLIIFSDTWYQQLFNMMDVDIPAFGAVYCILMIVVGQFFLMNLILAVIIFSFVKTQKQELGPEIKALDEEQIKVQIEDVSVKNENPQIIPRENNEFAAFLKPQAQKRKIAQMFKVDQNDAASQEEEKMSPQQKSSELIKSFDISDNPQAIETIEREGISENYPHSHNKINQSDFKFLKDLHSPEIIPPTEAPKLNLMMRGAGNANPTLPSMAHLFKLALKKKIEQEIENYFKQLLNDAKQDYDFEYVEKNNLREYVKLKVGLDFVKYKQIKIAEKKNSIIDIENRKKANRIYMISHNIIMSSYFSSLLAFFIIVNTLVLSLDRYPVDLSETAILEKVNIVLTILFTMEMIIKMIALGFTAYFKLSAFNIFDCIIVIASISDIFVSNLLLKGSQDKSSGTAITALRGFRLLRIFKLAEQWKRFELLLETLGRTLVDIATFSILLFLFIFTFTLLGLELFAERAKFDRALNVVDLQNGKSPEFNFDNFFNSFTSVFLVLTNDSTAAIYQSHYRAVGGASATIFFILMIIIGQKILLNLFVAILLQNFDESALKHKMHEYEQNKNSDVDNKFWFKNKWDIIVQWIKLKCSKDPEPTVDIKKSTIADIVIQISKNGGKGSPKKLRKEVVILNVMTLEGKSLNLLSSENKFRKLLYKCVTHPKFDYVIIPFIIISAIELSMNNQLNDPQSSLQIAFYWVDLSTTIVFILEALAKIMAQGFLFNGRWSYLRQSQNIFDFIIIIFSVSSLTPLSDNLKTFKIFRILRVLRLISRNEGLKVAVRALVMALPNIANITIIMLLFFLIFGVVLVSYFKGKLFLCSNPMSQYPGEVISKWDCINVGGEWINSIYNFDNTANALITLFVLSTTSGWADVMKQVASSTQIDYLPGDSPSTFWVIFFIIFMIVGSFFFLNLFVGVVISTFNTEHDKLGGNDLLTEKQKEWIELRLLVLRSAPLHKIKVPNNKFRKVLFQIQSSKIFERFILFCILANSVVLFLQWYEQPSMMDKAGEILNYIFTGIFFIEAVIKMIAVEPRIYFDDGWNTFDTVIVVGSAVSIFVSANSSLSIRGSFTILRIFRVLRLLRLIKRGNSLQMIFNTFVITLHALSNIGGLLLLFIFMYSILGMILFGQVKRNGIMNEYINFENFFNSFMTLFIVATGDSWSAIMAAFTLVNSPSYTCITNPSYQQFISIGQGETIGCGNLTQALTYFVSYQFVINLVFLKIFIAIILQGYNDTQIQDKRLFNNDMNDHFRNTWTDFDPEATSFIHLHQLRGFLFALGVPLGFDESYTDKGFVQDQFIASLELPTYSNFSMYQFLDVLDALSFRLMVLDHIKKHTNNLNSHSKEDCNSREKELFIKIEIQKEINRLIYQKQSENISAVKEVSQKETKRVQKKNQTRDQKGFTSSHHMAAEATVRKMKYFLIKCRESHAFDNIRDDNSSQHLGKLFVLGTRHIMQRGISIVNENPQLSEDRGTSGRQRFRSSTTLKKKQQTLIRHRFNTLHVDDIPIAPGEENAQRIGSRNEQTIEEQNSQRDLMQ